MNLGHRGGDLSGGSGSSTPCSNGENVGAPVVAVGAVAISNGAILLVCRSNPPEQGRWTLPGGRVCKGETLAHAVEREVLEETNLVVRCGALRGFAERIYEDHHYVILDFDVDPGEPADPRAGDDAASVAWVPLAELRQVDTTTGLVEFLEGSGVLDDFS